MSWFELGRATVCVMLVYSWVLSVILYFAADGMPYTFNLAGMKTPPPRLLAWAALGLVVQIGLCWAFYRTNHWLPELGILLNLYLIRVIHKNTWDSDVVVELGRYVPFATALAWHLLGRALAPTSDPTLADRFGWEAAAGALAASMALNGVTKFTMGGTAWFTTNGMALMLAERSFFGPSWLRRLRLYLATLPRFSTALGMLGIVLETASLLYAVPSLRAVITVGILATVIGIEVLFGYFEPEWTLVYPAIAVITLAA